MIKAYKPASTSSNITPHPLGIIRSIFRHPRGLTMSIILKEINPIIARSHVYFPQGATSSGIHVPTYSSITTARGSGPQYCSITLEVQTPTIVTTIIREMVVQNKRVGLRTRYNPYHNTSATNAVAVPGATGTRPVYKPVERTSWKRGAILSFLKLLSLICCFSQKSTGDISPMLFRVIV